MATLDSDSVLLTGAPGDRGRRLTPRSGLAWLEVQAAAGRTLATMATELGISRDQLHRAIKADPKAREAYRVGSLRSQQSPTALVVPSSQGRALAIAPAGLECIRSLAARGASKRSAASALGVPPKTFLDALERQPEASAAWEAGHAELEAHGITNLVKLSDSGSVAATIFLLKNVAGWTDTGPKDGGRPTTNVVINLPGSLTREQYLATIETSGEASGDDA